MYVGTDMSTVPFYERFGFRREYTARNFFVDNYEKEVIDETGKKLEDMEYLSIELKKIRSDHHEDTCV